MRSLFLALIMAIALAPRAIAPAHALDEYRVSGVAANDALNMRDDVADVESISRVPVIGTIPWDGSGILATGVTVKIGASLWREVRYGGVTGWVNARFLKSVRRRFVDLFPLNMDCQGTEPFWSLKIRGDEAVYAHETTINYVVAARRGPANRNTVLTAITLVRQGPHAERIALVRQEACDTGMSAHDFPYSAMILGAEAGIYDFGPFMGCCSMPR